MNKHLLNTFAAAFAVLLMAAGGASAQTTTYSNAVANLSPAGYWQMHETTAPAPGDIETNYGSLGALGNAYYPDWVANYGAFVRQKAGPLANGVDQSVYFTQPVNNAGAASNSLFVPHTSPLATIRVPFSVEFWYNATNLPTNSFEGDILAQCDAFRLAGFRVYFQNQGLGSNNLALNGADILFYNHTTANQAFQVNWGAVATNTWHHYVATIDTSSNVSTYLDGVLQSAAGADPRAIPAGRFDPDIREPLTIGNGLGNQRGINGEIAEVAFYTNALGTNDIATHYRDGTNASAGASQYYNDVLSDNPTIYLRMNSLPYSAPASSTWPAVVNYGETNGTAVSNGVYTPGTIPGEVAGTNYGSFALNLASANVALLSGVSSFADVGNAGAYNPAGTTPFTVSALFRGNPTDTNRVQSIVGHGTNSWELGLTLNGSVVFNSGTNSTAVVATGTGTGDLVSTTATYNDGNWHWVVAVHNGTTNVLYLDNAPNNTNVVTASNVGNSLDMQIGSDPSYTNNPIGWGRQFAGQVTEVAFFTNALTATQIQSLYNALGITLSNVSAPIASRVSGSDMFTVTVSGSAPAYQWYYNTTSNYSGATAMMDGGGVSGSTNAGVTIANLADYYFVVITNNYGAVTSSIVQVPQLLTAVSAGEPVWNQANQTNVIVYFSYGVDPVTATTTGNYLLNNGASVVSAAVVASNEVALTTSALSTNTSYTLTVQNVENYFGVTMSPSPANLAVGVYPTGLALWVRGDTGVTTNSDGTVTQWNDLSGNGNNLLGGTFYGFTDPLLTNNALGDTVVHFASTNGTYGSALYASDAPALRITGDMTVVAVVNFAMAGFPAGQGEIVSKTGSVNANVPAPYDYHAASNGMTTLRGNGNTANGSYGTGTVSGVVSAGTPHIMVFSGTSNIVNDYIDGTNIGSGVLAANGGGNYIITNCADAGQNMFVGGRGDAFQNNAEKLNGDISELMVIGLAITPYDVASLDSYLIARHNLPIVTVNTNPTKLNISAIAGNQFTLSWPANHIGWQIQSNSVGLTATNAWFTIAGSTATNQITITPSPANVKVFYRMFY